jgi:hypothetical protein
MISRNLVVRLSGSWQLAPELAMARFMLTAILQASSSVISRASVIGSLAIADAMTNPPGGRAMSCEPTSGRLIFVEDGATALIEGALAAAATDACDTTIVMDAPRLGLRRAVRALEGFEGPLDAIVLFLPTAPGVTRPGRGARGRARLSQVLLRRLSGGQAPRMAPQLKPANSNLSEVFRCSQIPRL